MSDETILVVLLLLVIIGIIIWVVVKKDKDKSSNNSATSTSQPASPQDTELGDLTGIIGEVSKDIPNWEQEFKQMLLPQSYQQSQSLPQYQYQSQSQSQPLTIFLQPNLSAFKQTPTTPRTPIVITPTASKTIISKQAPSNWLQQVELLSNYYVEKGDIYNLRPDDFVPNNLEGGCKIGYNKHPIDYNKRMNTVKQTSFGDDEIVAQYEYAMKLSGLQPEERQAISTSSFGKNSTILYRPGGYSVKYIPTKNPIQEITTNYTDFIPQDGLRAVIHD